MRRSAKVTVIVAAAAIAAGAAVATVSAPPLRSIGPTLPAATDDSAGLQARFFGVSTILLSDSTSSLMIDGFFTRPGPLRLFLGWMRPDKDRIDAALKDVNVGKVEAVLVAHSHHDHALDSATVAQRWEGTTVEGSCSTANIALGQGFDRNLIRVLEHGDVRQFGPFRVTVFETPHSLPVTASGVIYAPLTMPARRSAFKAGENFSFLIEHKLGSVLVAPSSNYGADQFKGVKADVVFLGITYLGKRPLHFTRRYWRETVVAAGAKHVVPIHWDDITNPLREPLRPLPYVVDNLDMGLSDLRKVAGAGVTIYGMPVGQAFLLPTTPVPNAPVAPLDHVDAPSRLCECPRGPRD